MVGISSKNGGVVLALRVAAWWIRLLVDGIEDHVDRLVAFGPKDRGAEDVLRISASTMIFMKPSVSPFSTSAAESAVMGRDPIRSRLPVARASASLSPTRPSGGSVKRA